MIFDIVSFLLGLALGGGAVFVYLHKHQTAAIATATKLATDVADLKVDAKKA